MQTFTTEIEESLQVFINETYYGKVKVVRREMATTEELGEFPHVRLERNGEYFTHAGFLEGRWVELS
jgi:hypothetical protein